MGLAEEVNRDAFRDSIATVDEEGKRNWIYPKKPKGRFYKWRSYVSYVLLAFFFSAPFIKIGGEPLLMLNVIDRKFVFFGQIFWPQDFYLFVIGMITMIVFIILFTVIYGRLFCGWVCPQTIFMEMVFRKIEYWIEGDFRKQRKLDQMKWNGEKIRKKTLKHAIFFGLSFIISNLFLIYIIGDHDWFSLVSDSPKEHVGGLTSMVIFTGVFYGVFAKFREQVCTVVCPYGRLQGVLLDSKSIVVAYDFVRGEKRGRFKRREDREEQGKGDCIDCHACVDVCPTGIDIRNGTQLECINCTACIDACDAIMDKVGFDRGLIRYASEENIREKKEFTFTSRMFAYTGVLGVLVGVLLMLFAFRTDAEATILRAPGTIYQETEDGRLSNLYQYKVINKTNEELPINFQIESDHGEIKMVGKDLVVKKGEYIEGAFFIILDESQLDGMKTKVEVGVYGGGRRLDVNTTSFIGPVK
ncbi:cytochrome c oxidase accessory protein CcoG [Salibacter sp.]|uniref:cytochrome c oxidase accessory protein CcoG n=1 Tax=Salibacter sp. TaxID=2010995 RepID=UPI0028701D05|nr:cytochrome c oxidase accessory protein CcoG [Salibacter sp.]MDR9398497.1 cytochrome c oxidase accessory protein CcoG [Salibacter sp.]MDR9486431.1 cytochrome c oxidase accessory protein CcoG [Salibacter sp.]